VNFKKHTPESNLMARLVKCIKLGVESEGLDFPPYPGPLGKRLWEEVSKQAWADWMKQQTMLVNENRLNLADQRARQRPDPAPAACTPRRILRLALATASISYVPGTPGGPTRSACACCITWRFVAPVTKAPQAMPT
jgi:Fe-S cluster biosynthesis and repair protein YggX